VVVNLYGADLPLLDAKAEEFARLFRRIEGAADVQLRSPVGSPLVQTSLDLQRLAGYGIRSLEAADAVETAFGGRVVGHYYENHRGYEVAVILAPEHRQQVEQVAGLPLRGSEGITVNLGQVADIAQVGGRYNILHQGGQRVQTVTGRVVGRDLDSFLAELKRRTYAELSFPADMYPEFTGASVEQAAAREQLVVHSLLAGTGILLLVYVAIGSLRHTLLTLANLPFSLVGGVVGGVLADTSLSVGALVGFVTLFGITVRNTIMLVSHYRHLVEKEGVPWDLLTVVVGAQQRPPSILMTALVTALAMLPIAIDSDNPGR